MADFTFSLSDNSDEFKYAASDAINRALEIIGGRAEDYAKGLAPVDTGNLRNSLTHDVAQSEQAVYVGSNVEYAPYQEYGTIKTPAANGGAGFLRPAINTHLDEYKDILHEELQS